MGLVVIAGLGRDLGQARGRAREPLAHACEPDLPRDGLGPQPHLGAEPRGQVAAAAAELGRERGDPDIATGLTNAAIGPRDRRCGRWSRRDTADQESLEHVKARVPVALLPEPVGELAAAGPERVFEGDAFAPEVRQRPPEDGVGPERRQLNIDRGVIAASKADHGRTLAKAADPRSREPLAIGADRTLQVDHQRHRRPWRLQPAREPGAAQIEAVQIPEHQRSQPRVRNTNGTRAGTKLRIHVTDPSGRSHALRSGRSHRPQSCTRRLLNESLQPLLVLPRLRTRRLRAPVRSRPRVPSPESRVSSTMTPAERALDAQ